MRSPFVAILAVMGLLCLAFCGVAPVTRAGVQCPTAPVQTIVVRDCCDHVVQRAPRPGDKVFVQCRCAEKRSSVVKAAVTTKIVLFLATDEPFETAPAFPTVWLDHVYVARAAAWLSEPPVRPPTLS